jgi:hypothetical protein
MTRPSTAATPTSTSANGGRGRIATIVAMRPHAPADRG